MKGIRSEGKLEWNGWKVKADQNQKVKKWRRIRMKVIGGKKDQNESDEKWRRIRMKGMRSEGGLEWIG